MEASRAEYNWVEQRSFFNFLVVESCNLSRIYRIMCDAYQEAIFSKIMFTNELKMSLILEELVENTDREVETIAGKEKVQQSVKKIKSTVFCDMKGIMNIGLLENNVTLGNAA